MRRGPGRPHALYSLTAEAQSLFPKEYDTLTNMLLREIASQEGPARLQGLLDAVGARLAEEYRGLDARVSALDDMLAEICREDERCKRLTTLPGVGPIVATTLIAAIDDGRHFASGRALSAWIGLVPRQYTTGGKPRLGGIGNRANHYLRRQLIHGARSALLRIAKHDDRRSKWAQELQSRAGHNKTLVAMANKTARMAWAMLRSGESYKMA